MEKIQRFGVPRRLFRRSDVRYSPRRDRSNRLTVLSRLMDSAFVITRDWAEATTAALIACLPIMVQGECELLTIIELYLARGRGHYKETRFVNRGPSRFHPANFLYLESRFHPIIGIPSDSLWLGGRRGAIDHPSPLCTASAELLFKSNIRGINHFSSENFIHFRSIIRF